MSKIAFDIGSTVTRVSVGDRILFQQPTCLALERETGAVVAIGTQAYSLLGKTAKQIEILFPVLAGVVADTNNLSAFLSQVLKEIKPDLSKNIQTTLFGHRGLVAYNPCSTVAQKARLQAVFQHLGLRTQFILRPEAIAVHLTKKQPTQSLCLIDIGGSSSICSIITNFTHVQSYEIPWGGIQLTESLQRYLAQKEQFAVGWHEAERLKRALVAVFTEKTLAKYRDHKSVVRGQDLSTHVGKTLVVSREQLAEIVQPQAIDFLNGVTEFLALLPREVVSAVLASGITLVGGGSQLPGLAELLQEKLACEVISVAHPDLACVQGLQ
ncbi:MAG: hypothetical protein GW947_00260 [Candidatus Pacebacteria bacterium]|nr:hypothetical protein [Candidatus Paceibacterota bacterium]PIR59524.1 MAG: hypothetical protein COU68_05200 [Candidatus Pacebacteria bacterium CG10_big_fil_rev_8_21_14_0_10_45_6]